MRVKIIAILLLEICLVVFLFEKIPMLMWSIKNESPTSNLPMIYAITPTYKRLVQKAELTRLSQTLMHLKNFHWIVVEDAAKKTKLVENLLEGSNLNYTHLNVKTLYVKYMNSIAKGIEQRNLGIKWLRNHMRSTNNVNGVVYFMDDDNTYSLKIFEEMRRIKNVGVWPVGISGGMIYETPLIKNGKVSGYQSYRNHERPFPFDLAGFAVNSSLFLKHPDARFSRAAKNGFQESEILKYFTRSEDLEPLAENCTKIYVWHTRTMTPKLNKVQLTSLNQNDFEV